MAMVTGIKEKVHLPLYDALFVRPRKQLREVEGSNVLKFFVHVQGKSKLETNMQAAALLPHWNTFEARAMRVVISDLPVSFPKEVVHCLTAPNGSGHRHALATISRCLDALARLISTEKHSVAEHLLATAHTCVTRFRDLVAQAGEIQQNLDECLSAFTPLADQHTMGRILQLHRELSEIRLDLVRVLSRTGIQVTNREAVRHFISTIQTLGDGEDVRRLVGQMRKASVCVQAFRRLIELLLGQPQQACLQDPQECVEAIEELIHVEATRVGHLERVRDCLQELQTQIGQLETELKRAGAEAIRRCLRERLGNELLIPIDEQLFGNGIQILAKIIYNSVTTFFVGEKTMMQMPTWFFPAGAGPYSDDGRVVTHGVPTPEATLRFAEPVFIDARQHFRVEIEIPEATVLGELQRIYGPFFIWVVLDGYMQRDVQ